MISRNNASIMPRRHPEENAPHPAEMFGIYNAPKGPSQPETGLHPVPECLSRGKWLPGPAAAICRKRTVFPAPLGPTIPKRCLPCSFWIVAKSSRRAASLAQKNQAGGRGVLHGYGSEEKLRGNCFSSKLFRSMVSNISSKRLRYLFPITDGWNRSFPATRDLGNPRVWNFFRMIFAASLTSGSAQRQPSPKGYCPLRTGTRL
jgi:hypothetical protein